MTDERERLSEVCKAIHLTSIAIPINATPPEGFARSWRVDLRRGGRDVRRMSVRFHTGGAARPRTSDVVHSVCLDAHAASLTFEQYCAEFSLDTDSRRAWRTWRACRSVAARVRRFLGEHYERCTNAEH